MENLKVVNIEQPFWLRGDTLYVSDDFAKYIAKGTPEHSKNRNDDFFNGTIKTYTSANFYGKGKPHTWESIKEQSAQTDIVVRWSGMYAMNIHIKGRMNIKNDSGIFHYYIGGNSGDSEMHGKNMIRATRQCNIEVITKYFPIFKYIKNAYKKLQVDAFFDVIKNAVIENPKLKKYITKDNYPNGYEEFIVQLEMERYNL